MKQVFEYPYNGARLARAQTIGIFEAIEGVITDISINAPNVAPTGDYIFNVKKNGENLFSGGDRFTINAGSKRVEKNALDIETAEADVLTVTLEAVGQAGLLAPVFVLVTIDDGVSGGADVLDDLSDVTLTSPANNDFLQRKSGVFVNRSVAQVKTDLNLSNTNSGDQTAVNVGASGSSVFKELSGGEFRFRKIKAGSNVTVTENATDIEISASGGGGGASDLDDLSDVAIMSPSTGQVLKYNGSVWINDTDDEGAGGNSIEGFRLDSEPPSPSAQSDWFRGSTIDSKWTRFQNSYSTLSVNRNSAKHVLPSQSVDRNTGIFQPLPSGDCTLLVRIFFDLKTLDAFTFAGISLFADAANNPNTCKLTSLRMIYSTSAFVDISNFTKFDAYDSLVQSVASLSGDNRSVYLRWSRSGTNWTGEYSLDGFFRDGVAPAAVAESSFGFTPAEFGLTGSSLFHGFTNTARFASFRYFNYAKATLID